MWSTALLHHVAIYLLANQIDTFLQNLYKDRFNHSNPDIKSAAWIARLIRNSFSHNPFYPVWLIDRDAKNKIFSVKNILQLDTTNLNGKFLDRSHYGGPLALLLLSNFVKKHK